MKNLILTLCVMLEVIFVCVYFDNECRGIRRNAIIDRSRIKELEEVNRELAKEVRLLKTDLYILQNGHEEKE